MLRSGRRAAARALAASARRPPPPASLGKAKAQLDGARASPRVDLKKKPQATREERGATGVAHVVAVASGKGGVGKSTTAANLAVALARRGVATGLLDLDVFGPSLPTMMGTTERPDVNELEHFVPVKAHGVACMSLGLLVPPTRAMVWRGPMVMGAVEQLLFKVDWRGLDVLVVDMPPGTGDTQLSLAQKVSLSGAVLVPTPPEEVALADVRRGAQQFRQMQVPILGVVQNMSSFVCPHCSAETHVFGRGGGQRVAEEIGSEVLVDVPLLTEIERGADAGVPVAAREPPSPQAEAYRTLAAKVWAAIAERPKPLPEIRFSVE